MFFVKYNGYMKFQIGWIALPIFIILCLLGLQLLFQEDKSVSSGFTEFGTLVDWLTFVVLSWTLLWVKRSTDITDEMQKAMVEVEAMKEAIDFVIRELEITNNPNKEYAKLRLRLVFTGSGSGIREVCLMDKTNKLGSFDISSGRLTLNCEETKILAEKLNKKEDKNIISFTLFTTSGNKFRYDIEVKSTSQLKKENLLSRKDAPTIRNDSVNESSISLISKRWLGRIELD